ncbi:MAG: thioesterase superfamily protein [Rhodocyclaceae bacterium]|nr:MAG: thioesterase superfamily protein [Rhodocyclaceae bacterium]
MSQRATPEHPERALVRRAIEQKLTDLPVTTNPLAVSLNMRIVEARDGRMRIGFCPPEAFTQGNGVVQGGIISAMLDFGMTFAAFSKAPVEASVATVSQTTNYFRPVFVGELIVEAELEKTGRTLINARASLYDAERLLLASATAPIAMIAAR